MLTIWRRHTANCPHGHKGRAYLKCNCPLWADGYVNGKRTLRQSLGTRDMARARKRATALEDPEAPAHVPVKTAVARFLEHCRDLEESTRRKYKNTLTRLQEFADARQIDAVGEMTTEILDAFRAARKIGPVTGSKELATLRQFFGFCFDRRWIAENIAKRIKGPKNLKPNDVEPYTANEVTKIIAACDTFGRASYERLRARGMVLLFRHTALRIGDVAMFARDRVTWDPEGECWRVFLHTEKTGAPVFLPIPDAVKQALDAVPAPRGAEVDPKYYFWNGITSKRAVKGIAERTLAAVFKESGVKNAHAHRFRHTLATELLGRPGATFEVVADILGNSPAIVRKHYAKWSQQRQQRISHLMRTLNSCTISVRQEKAPVTN